MNENPWRKRIGFVALAAAAALLAAGLARTYDIEFGDKTIATRDPLMVRNATFSGVENLDGFLVFKKDPELAKGKQVCPT